MDSEDLNAILAAIDDLASALRGLTAALREGNGEEPETTIDDDE